jgi:hypothetical protein
VSPRSRSGQGRRAALRRRVRGNPHLRLHRRRRLPRPIDIRFSSPRSRTAPPTTSAARACSAVPTNFTAGGDEFLRLAGSAFITYLINRRYGTKLSDSQNGFRAIRTEVFRSLGLRSRHTTIEMEMIMATLAAGHRIAEVPTHERPRAAGFSKISLSSPRIWLAYGWALLSGLCRRSSTRRGKPFAQ